MAYTAEKRKTARSSQGAGFVTWSRDISKLLGALDGLRQDQDTWETQVKPSDDKKAAMT
jgi:hypothetical protein